jgi:DNA helicase-2/ATP-dependent DNA helicase PcrA
VVGDDDQSIYRWRGADLRNILEFERDYPDARVVKLERNYRSTAKIIECAFEVIRRNKDRAEKRLWTENHPGDNVVVYEAVNESEEAEWVAQNIADQVERRLTRYGDYAVLYRTNAMSRNFEEALIAKGIPYRVVGGLRFYERAEIKDVVAYLRVLYNPADGVSLRRIINKPTRGIGDKTLAVLDQYAYENACSLYEALGKAEGMDDLSLRAQTAVSSFHGTMEELRQKADGLRLPELSNAVMEDSGYVQALREQGTAEAASRIENLQEFVTLAGKFREAYAEGEPDLGAFLQHISLLSDIDEAEDPGNAVSLLTLHSAKGLEFPVVFMVGLEENIFPHQRSMKDELELAEERRLCYVGITRAQRMLYMSHAFRRTIYGQPQDQRPSRFIGELPQDLITRRQDVSRLARPQIFEEEEAELEAAGGPKLDLTSILSRKKKTTDDRPSTKSKSPKKTRSTRSKAAAARAKGEGDGQAFKTGTKVTHPKFGDGIVVSTEGEADEAILTVAFLSTGVKKLAAAYAKLKRR